jgi:hypothetical protein
MHFVEWINNQYYNFNIHCYYTLQEMKYVYSLTRVGSAVILYQKNKQKCKIVSSQGGSNQTFTFCTTLGSFAIKIQ